MASSSLALPLFVLEALVVCSTEPNATSERYIAYISNTSQAFLSSGLDAGFDQSALLSTGLVRRQQCEAGYGYCSRWSICCPDGSGAGCCQDSASCVAAGQTCCDASAGVRACDVGEKCCRGGCAPDGATCCSGGTYCESPFTQCCEGGGCVPEGTQCCDGFSSDGRRKFCQAGNNCYAFDGRPNDIFCCTDRSCTARVENGVTSTISRAVPTTTTRQVAVTRTVYYTFTYTWYYYRYFFTIYQQASVVTSNLRTTTTIFSVQASNSIVASSLAEDEIATITASPPADASTQLASYTNRASSTAEETIPTIGVLNGDTDAQAASGTDVSSPTATLSSSLGSDVTVAAAPGHVSSSKWIVMGAVLVGLAVM